MKDKILTLIIGILIGAIIMACVFLVYTKNIEKKDENSDVSNVTSQENFTNQGFPQDGNMPQGDFKGGPRGDFNKNGNSTNELSTNESSTNESSTNEDRPTPPDGNFTGEKPDGELPARPEDNQSTTNTEN